MIKMIPEEAKNATELTIIEGTLRMVFNTINEKSPIKKSKRSILCFGLVNQFLAIFNKVCLDRVKGTGIESFFLRITKSKMVIESPSMVNPKT